MKLGKLALFLCIFLVLISSYAFAEVAAKLYYADGNTPLEYSDIMVGTQLKILIYSTESTDFFYGAIVLEDANIPKALLNAEEGYGTLSILPAAGDFASIFSLQGTFNNKIVEGYNTYIDSEDFMGDWFIVDYNAIELGDCSIAFYEDAPWGTTLLQTIQLNHVKTRDIDDNYSVGFGDFAYLAEYWQAADCGIDPNCHRVDFDDSNSIDLIDLVKFADYWLEKTR